MENEVLTVAQDLGNAGHDLSMIGLFLRADIIVQIVMVVLILASFWSWAIIVDNRHSCKWKCSGMLSHA